MKRIETGPIIASGAQHNVARHPIESNRLIKWPHLHGRTWNQASAKSIQRDQRILEEHSIVIPAQEVLTNPVVQTPGKAPINAPYAIVTEFVEGEILKEVDLKRAAIRDQLLAMLSSSLSIRSKESKGVDVVGGEAAGHFLKYPFLKAPGQLGAYNLRIKKDGTVVLIDTSLLSPDRSPVPFFGPRIVNGMIDLQHQLLACLVGKKDVSKTVYRSNHYWVVTEVAKALFKATRPLEALRERY